MTFMIEQPAALKQEIVLGSPDAITFIESRVSAWLEKAGPLIRGYAEDVRDLKVAELALAQARFALLDLAAEAIKRGEAGPDLQAIVGMGSTFSESAILEQLAQRKAAGAAMPSTREICEMLIELSRADIRDYAGVTKDVFTDL